MKAGDWVKITDGYWKDQEGEIFVGGERFAWIRLLDGEEVICLEGQFEALPILGQISLQSLETRTKQE